MTDGPELRREGTRLDPAMLDFTKGKGFVTVVTQDATTGEVLMVARADREAIERTLTTGEMHYHSRSRGLWHKGATSGNVQRVVSLAADCDRDAVLARVLPAGPSCHTGAVSCFGEADAQEPARGAPPIEEPTPVAGPARHHPVASPSESPLPGDVLERLARTIAARASSDDDGGAAPSYTRRLLLDRNLRLKKLGEEVVELSVACVELDAGRAAEEAADLLFHVLVALAPLGVTLADVRAVLQQRERR